MHFKNPKCITAVAPALFQLKVVTYKPLSLSWLPLCPLLIKIRQYKMCSLIFHPLLSALLRHSRQGKLNPLPNDTIFYLSKLKAFADGKINVKRIEICFRKGRKHCGKRRKCWLPAFSPYPTFFSKGFFHRAFKSRRSVVKG